MSESDDTDDIVLFESPRIHVKPKRSKNNPSKRKNTESVQTKGKRNVKKISKRKNIADSDNSNSDKENNCNFSDIEAYELTIESVRQPKINSYPDKHPNGFDRIKAIFDYFEKKSSISEASFEKLRHGKNPKNRSSHSLIKNNIKSNLPNSVGAVQMMNDLKNSNKTRVLSSTLTKTRVTNSTPVETHAMNSSPVETRVMSSSPIETSAMNITPVETSVTNSISDENRVMNSTLIETAGTSASKKMEVPSMYSSIEHDDSDVALNSSICKQIIAPNTTLMEKVCKRIDRCEELCYASHDKGCASSMILKHCKASLKTVIARANDNNRNHFKKRPATCSTIQNVLPTSYSAHLSSVQKSQCYNNKTYNMST